MQKAPKPMSGARLIEELGVAVAWAIITAVAIDVAIIALFWPR